MNFQSFTFRAEWLEAANELNDPALRAELLLAITTYGISGEYVLSGSPIVNALMIVIKAQIDATPARRKVINEAESAGAASKDMQPLDIPKYFRSLRTDYAISKLGLLHPVPRLMKEYATQCETRGIRYRRIDDFTLISHFKTYVEKGCYRSPERQERFFQWAYDVMEWYNAPRHDNSDPRPILRLDDV